MQYDVSELRKLLALVDNGVDVQGYKLKRRIRGIGC
jgi:hypothetical protein